MATSTQALATIGLLGIGVNAAALVLAPILRPDVNPLRSGLSHYAVGPWSGVQSAAFIALGIGSLAIARALWLVAHGDLATRVAAVMLGLASINVVGLAIFPMGEGGPRTPIGDLHLTAGTFAIAWQFISVTALLLVLRSWPQAWPIIRLGIVLLGVTLLGAAAIQIAIWRPDLGIPEGLAMRGVIVPLLIWWGIVAMTIRRNAESATGDNAPVPARSEWIAIRSVTHKNISGPDGQEQPTSRVAARDTLRERPGRSPPAAQSARSTTNPEIANHDRLGPVLRCNRGRYARVVSAQCRRARHPLLGWPR